MARVLVVSRHTEVSRSLAAIIATTGHEVAAASDPLDLPPWPDPIDLLVLHAHGPDAVTDLFLLGLLTRQPSQLVIVTHSPRLAEDVARTANAPVELLPERDVLAGLWTAVVRRLGRTDREAATPESAEAASVRAVWATLSQRQRQTLRLVAHGYRRPEVAARLGIDVKTVENHLRLAYGRIGAATIADATRFVLRAEGAPSSAPAAAPEPWRDGGTHYPAPASDGSFRHSGRAG